MGEELDYKSFIDNLWQRENMQGYKEVEGKGGYRNGRYYPYKATNGMDVGPGFDLAFQSEAFKKKAYSEGFTKEELNKIAEGLLRQYYKEHINRITNMGGNPSRLSKEAHMGLLDMRWQLGETKLNNKFPKFWNAVINLDYPKMQEECRTTYDIKGKTYIDNGRWDFRKSTYFQLPKGKKATGRNTSPIVLFPTYEEKTDALRVNKPIVFPTNRTFKYVNRNNLPKDLQYNVTTFPRSNKKAMGGSIREWESLSPTEKAEMMRVAIDNGITTLPEIKEAYRSFAEGGYMDTEDSNMYAWGGPSEEWRNRISDWEGAAMFKRTKDPLSGKMVGPNASFEEVARYFINVLPRNIREKVLNNPSLADGLYSYAYNVGPARFRHRVVPTLLKYYDGQANADDVAASMWASGDVHLRGLRKRRDYERAAVLNALGALNNGEVASNVNTESIEKAPFNPLGISSIFADTDRYNSTAALRPQSDVDMNYVYDENAERRSNLRRVSNLMQMAGMQSPLSNALDIASNPLMAVANIGVMGGNLYGLGSEMDNNIYMTDDGRIVDADGNPSLLKSNATVSDNVFNFLENVREFGVPRHHIQEFWNLGYKDGGRISH